MHAGRCPFARALASCVGRYHRAGDFGGAVHAIGVAGERMNAIGAIKGNGERKRIFSIGAADTIAGSGYGALAT
jgi:hypothetical protein